MHLTWESKNEKKIVTKVLIDGELYLIKGISNVKTKKGVEKVIEVGQKYLPCAEKE